MPKIDNFAVVRPDITARGLIKTVRRLIQCILVCSAGAFCQMADIAGGNFVMGGAGGEDDEAPARRISLKPFKIDIYETARAQYDSCVKAGACSPAHDDDGKCLMWTSNGLRKVTVPVHYRSPGSSAVCISWQQAREYCLYKGKRLPTEAEWEYAALAGQQNTYSWGNEKPSKERCTPATNRKPQASGTYAPNAWGLYDMTGNAWEWTNDRYEKNYYAYADSANPQGSPASRYRAIRGGGWYSTPEQLRIKNRQWLVPEYGEVSVGVRCVK